MTHKGRKEYVNKWRKKGKRISAEMIKLQEMGMTEMKKYRKDWRKGTRKEARKKKGVTKERKG